VFRPIYKANSLILGDPTSPVGVITCWTLKARVAGELNRDQYAAIGQLYSPTKGIDYLVRNLLANPTIRCLIVTGQDLSGSGQALRDFFAHGFARGSSSLGTPCWRIRSQIESFVDLDVAADMLERLRANVRLEYCPARAGLPALLDSLSASLPREPYAEPIALLRNEAETSAPVAEHVAFTVRGEKVADTWVQIVHLITSHGRVSNTHYESRQRELIDLVSVVTSEDPDDFHVPDYLPCDRAHIASYLPTVLTADPPRLTEGLQNQDLRYTYGQRLRSYFGVDQVADIITKLARERDSRSAVASLWDATKDHVVGGSPCLNHIWARIVDGTAYLTAVIRSNDMFKAWPENAFALRALQAMIARGVAARTGESLRLGELVILSQSAHIYDDDWDTAQHVLARHYAEIAQRRRERRDPRGNFVIELEGETIRVERLAASGEHMHYYFGDSAAGLIRDILADEAVSTVAHSLYLGAELAKAEAALSYPDQFVYTQDRQLQPLTRIPEVEAQ
jgi:thymidylate synthase